MTRPRHVGRLSSLPSNSSTNTSQTITALCLAYVSSFSKPFTEATMVPRQPFTSSKRGGTSPAANGEMSPVAATTNPAHAARARQVQEANRERSWTDFMRLRSSGLTSPNGESNGFPVLQRLPPLVLIRVQNLGFRERDDHRVLEWSRPHFRGVIHVD